MIALREGRWDAAMVGATKRDYGDLSADRVSGEAICAEL
jgi:hypothetical protein